MLRIGLTGGMGCGKSTVAAMFRERGLPVIDLDALARDLLAPGAAAYSEVTEAFGPSVLNAQGGIDRAALAAIVFRDPQKLERLNQIVHPRVIEKTEQEFARLAAQGAAAAIAEAALLIEAGYHKHLDRLIVVCCTPQQQRARLRTRGMSARDIEARLSAQTSTEEKRRWASDLIDNSGSVEHTRVQVKEFVRSLELLTH